MSARTLYIIIILVAMSLGLIISRKSKVNSETRIVRMLFWASYIWLLFFLVTNDSSSDFYGYVQIFKASSFDRKLLLDQEIGYVLLNAAIKQYISDPVIAVNLLRGLTLTIFYFGMYHIRRDIDIGFAVIAFLLISYFPIYTMLAYMLSSSLVFLGWVHLTKKEYVRFAISIFIAIMMHYTALLMVMPIMFFFFGFKGNRPRKYTIRLVVIVLIISVLFVDQICSFVMGAIPAFYKYRFYVTGEGDRLGLMQLVNYLPVLFFSLFCKDEYDESHYKTALVLSISGFILGQYSYSFINLQRVYTFFVFVYCVSTAHLMNKEILIFRGPLSKKAWKMKTSQVYFLMICYCVFRCVVNFVTFWTTSGFDSYHSIL